MATSIIVDPDQNETELQAETDAALAGTTAANEAKTEELPEKYRGKSIQDVIEMHRNAESELGRKNNEIGQVRKLADELIGVRATEQRMRENQQEPPKPLTADQLLENPEDSILRVVKREAVERTEKLEKRTADLESELMVSRFEEKHPGFSDTMQSAEFGQFVQGSNYRRKLALGAAKGDFDAADELFGLYEEAVASTARSEQPAPAAKPNTGVEGARKATLAKSGGSSASGVIPSGDGKKVFSRADLMDMRIRNPDKFDMMQDEILEAYREKRVR